MIEMVEINKEEHAQRRKLLQEKKRKLTEEGKKQSFKNQKW